MKVMIVTQKLDMDDDILGFVHNWVHHLAYHLSSLTVIALSVGRHDLPHNVEVISLEKGPRTRSTTLARRMYSQVSKVIKDVDLAFMHMCPEYVILNAPLFKLNRVPCILWYAHGTVSKKLRLAVSLSNRVLTSTPEGMKVRTKKKRVIGQGIDTERFPYRSADIRPNMILTVSRISKVKKIERIISVYKRIVKVYPALKLRIVGGPVDKDSRAYYEGLRSKNKRDEGISFTGSVPHNKIIPQYQGADIFLNLSETGSMDKTLMEACSCGLIPLTPNPAFRSFLGKYSSLLFLEKNDIKEITGKVSEVLSMSEVEKNKIRSYLVKKVKKEHDVRAFAKRVVKEFEDVLKA